MNTQESISHYLEILYRELHMLEKQNPLHENAPYKDYEKLYLDIESKKNAIMNIEAYKQWDKWVNGE